RPRDAGLLETDRIAVRAQVVDVVDVDGGDHRHVRIDQVDRVQAPTQPDLEHRQVQPGALEQPQGAERAVLEIGQRRIASGRIDGLETGHQVVVAGVAPVDAHALVVGQQV